MSKITVIDSIMGSGKTTWAINHIKSTPETPYIYVTPFLDEYTRIQLQTAPERDFKAPARKWPKKTKLEDFSALVNSSADIVITDALFTRFDQETKSALRNTTYDLIIEEPINVLIPHKITTDDLNILCRSNVITSGEDNIYHWTKTLDNYNGRFRELSALSNIYELANVHDTFMLLCFNKEIFSLFKNIYILTYMFDRTIMKYYFDYFNITYTKYSLQNNTLIPYHQTDATPFKPLINIFEGKINNGFEESALSKKWFHEEKNPALLKKIQNNLDNYLRNITKSKSSARIWTTFEEYEKFVGKGRYNKSYVPLNTTVINPEVPKTILAFIANIYPNPGIIHFLHQHEIKISRDLYALNILLHWIWQSDIRNNNKIDLYLPSERMRILLNKWLNNEILY